MSSLPWLALTVVLVAAIALTGTGPKGGKPVARTRLMGAARMFLILAVIVSSALGVWGAFGHRG